MTLLPKRARLWAWVIVSVFTACATAFFLPLRELENDPDLRNQLPPNLPSLLDARAVEQRFGGAEMVTVILEGEDMLAPTTLQRFERISKALESVPEVLRVISPFTLNQVRTGDDGELIVEPAIGKLPQTDDERAQLGARLESDSALIGSVLSRDLSTGCAIALLKADASEPSALSHVRDAVGAHPGPERLRIGGMPEVRRQVSADITTDMRRFAPAGLLVMFAFLLVALRQWRGVLIPLGIQVLTIVVTLGLIPLLGWKMQVVTVVLPVLLLAIGNDHTVHLISTYQEERERNPQLTASQLTERALRAVGWPIVLAGITTVAGFLCLVSHDVTSVAELGVLASFGLALVMLASLLLAPALLILLPVPRAKKEASNSKPWLDRLLSFNVRFVMRHKAIASGGCVVLGLVASAGLPQLRVDTNPVNYYPDSSPIAQTAQILNQQLGGATEVSVMVSGDIIDPAVMRKVDALERHLREMPEVGAVSSIAQVVRALNGAIAGEVAPSAGIPDQRDAISQLLLMYSMGADGDALERMIDADYRHAVVTARIRSSSTRDIQAVVERVRRLSARELQGLKVTLGGGAVVFSDLVRSVVDGQLSSLGWSFVVVFLLNALGFRSLMAGAWTMVPLLIATPSVFGLMGILGIELNVVTALLSSIMVGVGVDYTVHFLWRYREARQSGMPAEQATVGALTTVGRGVFFNAAAVMLGFLVLGVSNFLPVRFFGFLVVVSIAACLITALVLMPPLMAWLDPRFARPVEAPIPLRTGGAPLAERA